MADDHEQALLTKAKSGDQSALAELLEVLGPQVRAEVGRGISPKWRHALDEDDVMQVTYLEAFLSFDRFSGEHVGSLVSWLKRIASNNLRDAIRELSAAKRPNPSRRVVGGPTEESFVALVEVLATDSLTPSRDAAGSEGIRVLKLKLAELPEDYEKVITMYDLEARPAAEVAKALGRSEGAIFMLRARAHDRLRELMGSSSRYFTKHA